MPPDTLGGVLDPRLSRLMPLYQAARERAGIHTANSEAWNVGELVQCVASRKMPASTQRQITGGALPSQHVRRAAMRQQQPLGPVPAEPVAAAAAAVAAGEDG